MENITKSTENTNKQKTSFYIFKKVSVKDKYNFYEYLSVMLDSGISISEALNSVSDRVRNEFFKEKIKELIIFISSGDSFSKAMKKLPQVFDSSEVSMVETGETTGTLVTSFSRLSEDLKMKHDLHNKIRGSLTYPFIIFIFLFLAVLVVLIYVIPSLMTLFETSEVELPLATRMLIGTSDFIRYNFLYIVFFIVLTIFSFIGYKNTASGRRAIDGLLLSFPLVGKVYRNYILAIVSGTLGSLTGSGINIVKSLGLVGRSTNNAIYEDLFNKVVLKVSGGSKIVDSMQEVDKQNEYFTSDFLQMLSAGEKTASIEEISKKINTQYIKEVNYSLSNLTKWIEPIAIIIATIFVLWFAFAVLGAVLKVTTSMG